MQVLIDLILSLFSSKPGLQPTQTPQESSKTSTKEIKVEIDWTDPKAKVSKHFTVKEALWLPTWNRLAAEDDGLNQEIKDNLIKLCQNLDIVREYFNKPMNIHCMYRPPEYNKLIGGATHSFHMTGLACDFDISGFTCDEVRKQIMDNNLLVTWQMRMENNGLGAPWVHLDCGKVSEDKYRYFKP